MRSKSSAFIICLGLIALSLSVAAQPRKILPVDESAKDASFVHFKKHLLQVAKKRDVKSLLQVVDPNIQYSFGGDDNVAGFNMYWKINNPNSEFWKELITVLSLGGTMYKDKEQNRLEFHAPYISANFPENLDANSHLVALDGNTSVLAQPKKTSRIIAKLSYDVVKVGDDRTLADEWIKIKTFSGRTGYVNQKYVRSPLDYSAIFIKTNGKWKMTSFIAGD